MAFLHRFASGLKEGLVSLANGGESPRKVDGHHSSLQKQSSRGKRPTSSASHGLLESHIRDAIASFVQDKFDKGEAKPHVFTQFWLQFPKLETGFNVLRVQLESRTGSREGPLPLVVLQSSPQDFGLDPSSPVVRELCTKAQLHKCADIDFIGLVMLLLVAHLTEHSSTASTLHPDVRTMLSCLELAFTHFNSARKGKLDKREVGDALQYESAKAHIKEGRSGRTSNRLAHRLFEGLDWEYDNTISFENFLRGILQLVQDEFGDVPEEDEEQADPGLAAGGGVFSRRWGSSRVDHSDGSRQQSASEQERRRSASATGMVQRSGSSQEASRSPGSFLASLKAASRKSDAATTSAATTPQPQPNA